MLKKIKNLFRRLWRNKPLQANLLWLFSLGFILAGVFLAVQPMRRTQGMWYSFDDVQVIRTTAMVNELKRGQFPVRLLSDFGNGGGLLLFNFYSPLIYYLSAGLVLVGNHPLNAVKLAFQLCYLLAGLGMWSWLKRLLPNKPWLAATGGLLLLGSSYFNYDAYARGALAELAGFAVIPWVFWGYEYIKTTVYRAWGVIFLGLALSAVVYLHVITAFIVLPFLALRFLVDLYFHQIKRPIVLNLVGSGLLAIGLSASYLLPLMTEKSLAAYSQITNVTLGFRNSFVSFAELSGWQRSADPTLLPLTLGFWLSVGAIFALLFGWQFLKTQTSQASSAARSFWWFSALSLVLALFIQSRWSWPLWENSSLLQSTQFPYRYLTATTIVVIGLICFCLAQIRQKFLSLIIGLGLVVLTWQQNQALMTPSGFYFTDEFRAEDPCSSSTWQSEFFPKWMAECLPKGNSLPLASSSGDLTITDTQLSDDRTNMVIKSNGQAGELVITRYYFPGWQIQSSEQAFSTYPTGVHGLLAAKIPAGPTELRVNFGDTPIRTWANRISAVILVIGLGLFAADSLKVFQKNLLPKLKKIINYRSFKKL